MLKAEGLEELLRQKASETRIDSPAQRTRSSQGLLGSGVKEASTQDSPGYPQHLPRHSLWPGPGFWPQHLATVKTFASAGLSLLSREEGDSPPQLPPWPASQPAGPRQSQRREMDAWPVSLSGHTVLLPGGRCPCTPSNVPPETHLLGETSALGHKASFLEEEAWEEGRVLRAP